MALFDTTAGEVPASIHITEAHWETGDFGTTLSLTGTTPDKPDYQLFLSAGKGWTVLDNGRRIAKDVNGILVDGKLNRNSWAGRWYAAIAKMPDLIRLLSQKGITDDKDATLFLGLKFELEAAESEFNGKTTVKPVPKKFLGAENFTPKAPLPAQNGHSQANGHPAPSPGTPAEDPAIIDALRAVAISTDSYDAFKAEASVKVPGSMAPPYVQRVFTGPAFWEQLRAEAVPH